MPRGLLNDYQRYKQLKAIRSKKNRERASASSKEAWRKKHMVEKKHWRERFDELFTVDEDWALIEQPKKHKTSVFGGELIMVSPADVKSFIRTAIASAVEAERERLLAALPKEKHCVGAECASQKEDCYTFEGFNQAVSEFRELIKNKG